MQAKDLVAFLEIGSKLFARSFFFEVFVRKNLHKNDLQTSLFVDGHLKLRTPYPVRSVKLSSFKLG